MVTREIKARVTAPSKPEWVDNSACASEIPLTPIALVIHHDDEKLQAILDVSIRRGYLIGTANTQDTTRRMLEGVMFDFLVVPVGFFTDDNIPDLTKQKFIEIIEIEENFSAEQISSITESAIREEMALYRQNLGKKQKSSHS